MAVLGKGGVLVLEREAPEPIACDADVLHERTRSLNITAESYWSGDKVVLTCAGGLPTDGNPDGMAFWGGVGKWNVGASRAHITSDNDPFWSGDDDAPFWDQPDGELVQQRTLFLHVDILGRLSFYETVGAALRGSMDDRLSLLRVAWRDMLIQPHGIGGYTTGEVGHEDIHDLPPYESVSAGGSLTLPEWSFMCNIEQWSLETDSRAVDVSAVGQKFGESTKDIVSGSGTIDYLVDRLANEIDTTALMRLVLMVDRGCKSNAKFYMLRERETDSDKLLDGSLYYETDVLVVTNAISTRASDVIAGSATFVTTGDIRLRMGA